MVGCFNHWDVSAPTLFRARFCKRDGQVSKVMHISTMTEDRSGTALHDILWDLRNEDLTYRLKVLDIKPRSPRKADLIDALKAALHGEHLKQIWETLDDLQRNTVAEVCYDASTAYNPSRIRAKYGALPAFYNPPNGERSSFYRSDPKYATPLNLFLFESRVWLGKRIMPSDLARRLRGMIPEPPELRLPTLAAPPEEANLFIRQSQYEALTEVIALLHLADQGKLSLSPKTGKVSPAACRRITDCLIKGDFFPPEMAYRPAKRSYEQEIGPIKPLAWARLLQVAKYFSMSGSRSKLTRAGMQVLSRKPHEAIRHIWTKWLANTHYDEFNRIDEIKGQKKKGHMTAKPDRRDAIVDALAECPMGEWIEVDRFSDFMQAAGHEFQVSRDLWKLYLCDPQYGSLGYEGFGDWNIVQLRYILCFLFEYAATLGLIDIAYVHPGEGRDDYRELWGADDLEWLSRYDGIRCFRITELGAYCLGLKDTFEAKLPDSGLRLTVLPSLRIQIQEGEPKPAERLLLETWAEAIEANAWKLDCERALTAVERGQSPADFAEFLRNHDSQELPETVQAFIADSERNGQALQLGGEASFIRCRDAETANLICAQKELDDHCHRCNETLLAVASAQLPKFRKTVRSLGLGIR